MNIKKGQHLFTKDGRRCGNAIVTEVKELVSIETDYGSVASRLSEAEIESMFHLTCISGEVRISEYEEWKNRDLESKQFKP